MTVIIHAGLERISRHQRLLQVQPGITGWRMRVRIECLDDDDDIIHMPITAGGRECRRVTRTVHVKS